MKEIDNEQKKIKKITNSVGKNTDDFSNANFKQMTFEESETTYNGSYTSEFDIKPAKKPVEIVKETNLSEDEKEKIEDAQETVKKQSSKKKKWLNAIFLLINLGVVAGILTWQLTSDTQEVSSFGDFSSSINWGILFLVVVAFALIMVIETFRFSILCFKTTKKARVGVCFKAAALGRYYDSITPLSSGGEPFQIYYFSKRGVSGSGAVSITMGKHIIWQLAFVTFSLIVMIFSISVSVDNFSATTAVVSVSSWIGFAANSFVLALIGIISISKTLGNKIITGILKLLKKMRIVKDYDKQYTKITKVVNEYQITIKKYAKDKWSFMGLLLMTYVGFIINYSIPFLIYSAFYGFNFAMYGQIFIFCVMIDLVASFFPLPGGTGAAELSFTVLFASLFEGGNLFWALIIWRIFTYYAYIIQGVFVIIYDYFIGNKKHEWEKKKWVLESESRTFEDEQAKDFELSLMKYNSKKSKNKKEKKL